MTTKPDPLPPTPRCARCDQPISPCHSGPPAPAAPVEGPRPPVKHWLPTHRETVAPCGAKVLTSGFYGTSVRADVTCHVCQQKMVERGDLAMRTDWYESMKDGDPHPTIPGFVRDRGQPSGWRPAPAASPVREPPPKHQMKVEGECFSWCAGCRWRTSHGLPTDWEPAAPAAPAREPGELTFAEACAVAKERGWLALEWFNEVAKQWYAAELDSYGKFSLLDVVAFSELRYRRKPAPPAPKPGRLTALLDTWARDYDATWQEADKNLATRVAREALACVRRLVRDGDKSAWDNEELRNLLDAAALELLGEAEVKRGD